MRLYRTSSAMDRGTMYQIRNLIDRRNVTRKPKSDVNASEDFFEVVVIGYILAAVMCHLGMPTLDSLPLPSVISHTIWMEDDDMRRTALKGISKHIVTEFVDLETSWKPTCTGTCTRSTPVDQSAGTALEYSREVMSLGLLFLEFKDAIREGDGDRVLFVWRYLLLLYKASRRKNYAIEALTLLSQCSFILPANLAEQVKWSRFVNFHGLPGHNISCDLHMEHLNRLVKTAIDGLGANKSKKAISRVGKALGVLASATQAYDKELGVPLQGSTHSTRQVKPKILKDVTTIVNQLLQGDVFNSNRKHSSFRKLKSNLIRTISEKDFKQWMIRRFSLLQKKQPVINASVGEAEDEMSDDEEFRAVFGDED